MALTNPYASLAQLRTALQIKDSRFDDRLEIAINSASRRIDDYCGHRFWQDGSVVAREFYATDHFLVEVPEGISTATGLVVKIDDTDDGTFATTLTITTHFVLLPRNAALEVPAEPYRQIKLVDSALGSFPTSTSGRPGVQVTAKFGYPAVPDTVLQAAIIQSTLLFKSPDAAFGGVALGIDGAVIRLRSGLHPQAADLLDNLQRVE